MAAWTSVEEFYRYLREPAPEVGSAAYLEAQQALEAACEAIEDEAGQPPASSDDTVILDATGGDELLLPRGFVTAVASVTLLEDNEVLTYGFDADYTWSSTGILKRLDDCWPCGQRTVEAVYTAGLATVPMSLKKIAWRLVGTEEENPTGLVSETIADWSGKWAADVVAGAFTEAELATISRYALVR
jgi:hypothetical protein